MERIYLGKGVYRYVDNTQLFEVFTVEQMIARKNGTAYKALKDKKRGGGVHGMKVLAKRNKHKRLGFENSELVTKEQMDIIKRTVSIIDPPQVSETDVGESTVMVHDHSKDAEIDIPDDLPEVITEGTNIGNINPRSGEPYEDEDHEPFDEGFVGEDDGNDNGYVEDATGADGEDGEAFGSPESAEPESEQESGGEYPSESSEK